MRLTLKSDQKEHVKKLTDILAKNYSCLDLSQMGSGKTFTATAIAKEFDFERVLIICPASVVSKWLSMKKYGLKILDVLSYEGLRSIKNHDPKHGLLKRFDEVGKVYFEPTPRLESLAKEGMLVILDEAQRIKNKNAQWYGCKTIAETILTSGGLSRFILLSGTPIDKEKQALHLMEMLGYIRSDKLYTYDGVYKTLRLQGAQELVEFCYRVDSKKTQKVLDEEPFNRDNVEHICYKLFQDVIKTSITSSMPPPNINGIYIDIKNAEYRVTDFSDNEVLRKAVTAVNDTFMRFQYATRFGPNDKAAEGVQNQKLAELKEKKKQEVQAKIETIIYNLRVIENAKMRLFVQLAKKRLSENPHNKVALFVNYTSSIKGLLKDLEEYQPLVLDGSVDKEKRQPVIDKFQEHNTTHRVLIGNIRVCSSGIDLNDTSKGGKFPRYVYANPNLNILDLQQLPYRFLRLNSTSNTIFRFVYVKNHVEQGLLKNLKKKAKVMEETTGKGEGDSSKIYVGDLDMIDGDEELSNDSKEFE
jgi:SNF2 family DNA or RNA helicase